MNVLTVYAHPNPKSFCHAVLQKFAAGLEDAGHANEIIDLYGENFDPVLRGRDAPNWMDESIPADLLDRMNLRQELLDAAGGPLRRFLLKRRIGNKDAREIIRMLREQYKAKDIAEQQEKVARAGGNGLYLASVLCGVPGDSERVDRACVHVGLCPLAEAGRLEG